LAKATAYAEPGHPSWGASNLLKRSKCPRTVGGGAAQIVRQASNKGSHHAFAAVNGCMSDKGGRFRSREKQYTKLEDALYALAQREIDTGDVRQETWETAQMLARGNDRRAVAAYIRIRVRVLLEAHEARNRRNREEN